MRGLIFFNGFVSKCIVAEGGESLEFSILEGYEGSIIIPI